MADGSFSDMESFERSVSICKPTLHRLTGVSIPPTGTEFNRESGRRISRAGGTWPGQDCPGRLSGERSGAERGRGSSMLCGSLRPDEMQISVNESDAYTEALTQYRGPSALSKVFAHQAEDLLEGCL
jgi:hypothetical protein